MARVFQTQTFGDAQLKVALVSTLGMADLAVCRVGSWGMARGDALWFITRHLEQATVRVMFCSPGAADLNVCFVATPGLAGWQRDSRWQGRLG
ncbi:MAG TPA: DUF6150 family protein [Polyangiaceae bacterium]|jgi:hypothetical protein|nr:DUF6150 family protein [Polyangiaceae bacterium]